MTVQTTRIKKRKYSRNGCKECKRRKIKCDEAFPACINCSRLKKNCVYDPSIIPSTTTDQQLSKNGGALRVKMYRSFEAKPKPPRVKSLPSSDTSSVDSKPTVSVNVEFPASAPTPMLSVPPPPLATSELSERDNVSVTAPDFSLNITLDSFDPPDLLGLFNRASDLVHDMSEFLVPVDPDGPASSLPLTPSLLFPDQASKNGKLSDPSEGNYPVDLSGFDEVRETRINSSPNGITERLLLLNTELIQNCILEHTLQESHVEYLKTLTTTDLSYHIFPYASLIESNGGVKLLLIYLAKCLYLLSSLLAISALFQFNQTGKPCHDSARQMYTSKCLKSLSEAFAEYSSFSDASMLASNIELLLLTILVLSSCFTATKYNVSDNYLNQWQTHLKGARDLLIDYSQKTKYCGGTQSLYMTSGLAFAKCWFFAIETSAVLHTTVGRPFLQTISDPEVQNSERSDAFDACPSIAANPDYEAWLDTGTTEARANANYHNALERAGLICPTRSGADFNLFWGYTSTAVRMIVTLDSIKHAIVQRHLTQVPSRWIIHLMGLVDGLLADSIAPGVTFPTFEVNAPKIEPGQPSLASQYGLPEACFSTEHEEGGIERTYSWFDASNHAICNYMYLRILTSKYFLGLPRTHPQVQALLKTIFQGCFFIKSKNLPNYKPDSPDIILQSENFYLSLVTFGHHCIMLQSILRVISGAVVDDLDFEKIELFFMGLVKLGNGSALAFLDNVIKFKRMRHAKREKDPDYVDDEVYDTFSFLGDIPFA